MMMLVNFYLANGENRRFTEAIKMMGNCSSRFPNSWLLETNLTPRQVRDLLGQHLQENDRLLVTPIGDNWTGWNMGAGFADWMSRRKGFLNTESVD